MYPRLALVNPGTSARFAAQEPLNIGFIASYLENHNVKVKIIDQLIGENVKRELEHFRPDIVGITATTAVVNDAYEIAHLCKRMGIITVMGGIHASVFPEEALQHVDIVVKGEGEKAMLDIIKNGITSGIVTRPYIEDLNEIPLPARHLMRMDKYIHFKRRIPYATYCPFVSAKTRIAHILTSRGCPYAKCIFCHNKWRNAAYRADSPEKVVSEVMLLKKNYNVQFLYYIEDNFFADKNRAMKICELLIKNKLNDIPWNGSARVDYVDLEVLKLAKKAGCKAVILGIESGSQRILDILKKGTTVEQSKRAVEIIRRAGLIPYSSFMIGNPTETMDDIEKTKKFIKENKLPLPGIYIFTPYPGCEAWNSLKEQGLLPEKLDWRKFTQERVIVNASKIPTGRIESLRAEIYLHYYLTHVKEGLELIVNTFRHPSAAAEKILLTLYPFFNFWLKKLFKTSFLGGNRNFS